MNYLIEGSCGILGWKIGHGGLNKFPKWRTCDGLHRQGIVRQIRAIALHCRSLRKSGGQYIHRRSQQNAYLFLINEWVYVWPRRFDIKTWQYQTLERAIEGQRRCCSLSQCPICWLRWRRGDRLWEKRQYPQDTAWVEEEILDYQQGSRAGIAWRGGI